MARRYRKIDTRIWNDESFMDLSERAKLAFVFLLSHPFMTAIGAMRGTVAGLGAEMGLSESDFRPAFEELVALGMVAVNERAAFLALPNFIRYNVPENANVVKGWGSALDLIPECPERDRHLVGIVRELLHGEEPVPDTLKESLPDILPKAFVKALGEWFVEWFGEGLPKPLPKPLQEPFGEPFRKGSGNGSPKGMGNQEQEQLTGTVLTSTSFCAEVQTAEPPAPEAAAEDEATDLEKPEPTEPPTEPKPNPDDPVVAAIPLIPKDGEFEVRASVVAEFRANYPGVDVEAELRRMRAWSQSNPTQRKTRKGAMRFINGWLAREQDRGRGGGNGGGARASPAAMAGPSRSIAGVGSKLKF